MEKFLKKNLKTIAIIAVLLFFFKSFQSCSRKATITNLEKTLTEECDSITTSKILEIDSLNKELITKEFLIMDLTSDLKVAGVRVNEAQKRASAVEKTARSVRSNTTIQVKGVERDTIN